MVADGCWSGSRGTIEPELRAMFVSSKAAIVISVDRTLIMDALVLFGLKW